MGSLPQRCCRQFRAQDGRLPVARTRFRNKGHRRRRARQRKSETSNGSDELLEGNLAIAVVVELVEVARVMSAPFFTVQHTVVIAIEGIEAPLEIAILPHELVVTHLTVII